jgi:aromatic-amino-acid transaminase
MKVIEVLISRDLIPFLDIAYQGFGVAWKMMPTPFALSPAPACLRWSATRSRKFSPVRRARGRLSVVCEDADAAGRVLGQLKATVRRNYSSPPGFGAQVVSRCSTIQS